MNTEKPERVCKRWRAAFDRRYRRQQTYRVLRDDEIGVAEQMVNTEKPERGCKRWRSVFDRDGGEEQCSRTTIRPEVVWGVLDGPA